MQAVKAIKPQLSFNKEKRWLLSVNVFNVPLATVLMLPYPSPNNGGNKNKCWPIKPRQLVPLYKYLFSTGAVCLQQS